MKTLKNIYSLLALLALTLTVSCEEDTDPCEDDNIGTIILENKRTEGNLQLYINPVRIGINTPGDISVKPGEKGTIDVPAGEHNIVVRLMESSCAASRCRVEVTPLDAKTLSVSSCQDLNMAY